MPRGSYDTTRQWTRTPAAVALSLVPTRGGMFITKSELSCVRFSRISCGVNCGKSEKNIRLKAPNIIAPAWRNKIDNHSGMAEHAQKMCF